MVNNLMSSEELASFQNMLPQSDPMHEAAARAVRAAMSKQQAERQSSAGMMRRRYEGPWRDRPVVNGRAMVSAEELADFRRQFGPQMTLRDLLNADRRGVPATPSAQDMRARGPQGVNMLPLPPGMIPGGAAGPAAAGRIPGEAERNIMNALMAVAPMMGAARLATARGAPAASMTRVEPVYGPTVMRSARQYPPLPPGFSAISP